MPITQWYTSLTISSFYSEKIFASKEKKVHEMNQMILTDHYALITGASSGIGAEFAWLLAQRGWPLIISARRRDRLEALKSEIQNACGVQVHVIVQDLAQSGSAQALFDAVQEQGWTVSVLVNNAGFGMYGFLAEQDLKRLHEMVTLNVTNLTLLTRLFGAKMAQRKFGYILNVSSVASFQPCPCFAAYAATKSYVSSLGEALYQEFKPCGVVVCTLYPGMTQTEFMQVMGYGPKGVARVRAMTAGQVAKKGLNALFRKKSSVTAGVMNKSLRVLMRFLPAGLAAAFTVFFVKRTFQKVE